ncbi:UNVERIFIED_CONTAM: type IV pilus assembly protein PilM [Brevibacillus sp. OAP136]
MWKRLLKGNTANWQVGLHFLPYAIKLAEVRAADSTYVRKQGIVPINPDIIDNHGVRDREWLAFELEKKVKEWHLRGKEAILSVPLSNVIIRRLSIPKVHDKEIRDLVEVEIENSLHLPFQNPVFDFVKIQNHLFLPKKDEQEKNSESATGYELEAELELQREQIQLMVIAAPEDTVQSYVETVRKAGLKPIAVDIEPLALYRTLDQEFPEIAGNGILMINITLAGAEVAIFSAGYPEFVRSVELSVPFFNAQRSRSSLEMARQAIGLMERENRLESYVNDLNSEMTRIMNFYQYSMNDGKQKVEQIYVTGDFGDMPKLAEKLRSRFSIPVHTPAFSQVVRLDKISSLFAFEAAVGLGLKEVHSR